MGLTADGVGGVGGQGPQVSMESSRPGQRSHKRAQLTWPFPAPLCGRGIPKVLKPKIYWAEILESSVTAAALLQASGASSLVLPLNQIPVTFFCNAGLQQAGAILFALEKSKVASFLEKPG